MVLVVLVTGGLFMAYFLKKTTLKGRTYLAIYESFYSHEKKGTAHRSIKPLGSVETLKANGIDDPIAYGQEQVDLMNAERKHEKARKISDVSPMKYLGYFPLKSIMEALDVRRYVNLFGLVTDFRFDLFQMLSSLIYARAVHPCSKHRTFHEVLPSLYEKVNYSYDQLLEGVGFMGENYEKFVELFTVQVSKKYGIDTSASYFDCTNFYFEIDREDDFRRKGPSKENRNEPIIGLGLLLDANQIPVGMRMFPGNQSEQPVMRAVIDDLKTKGNITGKTVHVADKGLNCADNIAFSILNGDGYLFSRSIKTLGQDEKEWAIKEDKDNVWHDVKKSDGTLHYRYKSIVDEYDYNVTDKNGKKKKVTLKEKRLVTYNPVLAKKHQREINKLVSKAEAFRLSDAKRSQYGDCAKYVDFETADPDGKAKKAKVVINQEKIASDRRLAGYNMLVTSEIDFEERKMYDIYHNLWMIEESFKIMKSDLDARPAYLQKEHTIKGHFLICYLTVLLERIFQFKILRDRYSASEICEFFRNYRIVEAERCHINISRAIPIIDYLTEYTELPLDNYFLNTNQIKKVLNYRF